MQKKKLTIQEQLDRNRMPASAEAAVIDMDGADEDYENEMLPTAAIRKL